MGVKEVFAKNKISIGANKIAEGLIGSIDDLVVRVPVTF